MNEVIEKKYKYDYYYKIDIDSRKVPGIKWELYPNTHIYYPHIYSVVGQDPFIPIEAIIYTELINRY